MSGNREARRFFRYVLAISFALVIGQIAQVIQPQRPAPNPALRGQERDGRAEEHQLLSRQIRVGIWLNVITGAAAVIAILGLGAAQFFRNRDPKGNE